MFKKLIYVIFTSFLVLILNGCHLNNLDSSSDPHQHSNTNVTAIEELENTEHFRKHALRHILKGELNRQGQAAGFHYNQLPTKNGEIVDGTKTKENEQGVYEAEVIISDVKKNANGGKSSFFPDHWDSQEVVDAINEAFDTKSFINGNTYEGLTKNGIQIRMYVDQDNKIISAFPIY